MKKFKNKKLLTIILAFVMVLVAAGAFASFQALLRINARVNLYSPTVDAVIAEFSNTLQPLGVATNGMPVFRAVSARFPDREFFNVLEALGAEALGAGRAHAENAWGFTWSNPVSGTMASAGAVGGIAGNPPTVASVQTGAVANPRDFQSVYMIINFDNFVQAYEFEFRLANVGLVDQQITAISVDMVEDPSDDDFWHQLLPVEFHEIFDDASLTAMLSDAFDGMVNISGTFEDLVGDIMISDTGLNFANYSELATIRFDVNMDTWQIWANTIAIDAGLNPFDDEDAAAISLLLEAFEDVPSTFTFRLTYTVAPYVPTP